MTEQVTDRSTKLFTEERSEKIILKPEDFEKKITGRKKKPKTYIHMWDDILKFFIEIDLDMTIMRDYFILVEKYVNIFPNISKLIKNISDQIYEIELIAFLQTGTQDTIEVRKNGTTYKESREAALKRANKNFDDTFNKYTDYLYEISGISLESLDTFEMSINSLKPKKIIELMSPFLINYSHANTFKEALLIPHNFYQNCIFAYELWDEDNEESIHYIINPDIEKNVLKREVTREIQKVFNFQKKEHSNLKQAFMENLRRSINEVY